MANSAAIERSVPAAIFHALAAPFVAIGHFLVMISEAQPRMRELEKLGKLTDEQLAEKGLTREGELRRIMGASLYV